MKKLHLLCCTLFSCLVLLSSSTHAQSVLTLHSLDQLPQPAPLHITKLTVIETQIGTGEELVNGEMAQMHYTGWLYDHKAPDLHGAQFDSSKNVGAPLSFQVGARQVIRGWDLGVVGMKVGGKRTLLIPAYLAYSVAGSTNIPPNTHLVFEIELVSITK